MRFIRLIVLSSFLFSSHSGSGQVLDTTKVLFIGNSYTYFWNLPQLIMSMAESQGYPLLTRQSTTGGVNLGQHWRGERELKSQELFQQNDWDYVILQDHSLRAIEAIDSLKIYAQKWKNKVIEYGAQPILYMTWARKFNPLMTVPISEGYESVARALGIPVVPVGQIWETARTLRPALELYDNDGSHPSPIGTYLTACAFFQVLTGKSSRELPSRLTSEDEFGEKIYLMIVSPDDAVFCHDLVDRFLADYLLDDLSKNNTK